jgi:hypothetical protein
VVGRRKKRRVGVSSMMRLPSVTAGRCAMRMWDKENDLGNLWGECDETASIHEKKAVFRESRRQQ